MWIEYNPNPVARRVQVCAVRAVAKALDISWEAAFASLTAMAFTMGDMPDSNAVWGAVLRDKGFYRKAVPDTCPRCYTAKDFCEDNPEGIYVLSFEGHVATVVNGDLYDTWDSSECIPQYYWYKEE